MSRLVSRVLMVVFRLLIVMMCCMRFICSVLLVLKCVVVSVSCCVLCRLMVLMRWGLMMVGRMFICVLLMEKLVFLVVIVML